MMHTVQVQTKKRKISILQTGYSLNGILDILNNTLSPTRASDLHIKSNIHFRKRRFEYISYCLEKGFIDNTKVYGKKVAKPIKSHYCITEKGRQFLEFVS